MSSRYRRSKRSHDRKGPVRTRTAATRLQWLEGNRVTRIFLCSTPNRSERSQRPAPRDFALVLIMSTPARSSPHHDHALTESELRAAIDSAIDGMIVIDHAGRIVLYSAACERLFGYAAREVLGRNVNRLMPSPDRDNHDGYLRNYLKSGVAKIIGIGRDVTGCRKDGSTFPMRLSIGELSRTRDGSLFVGTIHDLSERMRALARIEELQADVIRVSRASALGTMGTALAHELNQPLSAISGFVEASAALLDQSGVDGPEKLREYMGKAVRPIAPVKSSAGCVSLRAGATRIGPSKTSMC